MTIDASKLVRRARKDLSKSDNPATRAAFFGIGLTSMAGGYLMGRRRPKVDAQRKRASEKDANRLRKRRRRARKSTPRAC